MTGDFTKARPPGTALGDPAEVPALNIFAFDVTTGNPVPFAHSLNAQGMVVRPVTTVLGCMSAAISPRSTGWRERTSSRST